MRATGVSNLDIEVCHRVTGQTCRLEDFVIVVDVQQLQPLDEPHDVVEVRKNCLSTTAHCSAVMITGSGSMLARVARETPTTE